MGNIGVPELAIMSGLLIFCAVLVVPMIFYLLTLQKALERCAPPNRAMTPGLVWLSLIPLFNLIWNFFIVLALAKSLGNEFRSRGMQAEAEPGQSIGLAYAILFCCAIVPFLGILAAFAGIVMWIVYWVKIADYSRRLALGAPVSA
jgi:hypothetical protein